MVIEDEDSGYNNGVLEFKPHLEIKDAATTEAAAAGKIILKETVFLFSTAVACVAHLN